MREREGRLGVGLYGEVRGAGSSRFSTRSAFLTVLTRSMIIGKPVSEREEKLSGALKYMWSPGQSTGQNLRAVQEVSPLPVSKQKLQTKPRSAPAQKS